MGGGVDFIENNRKPATSFSRNVNTKKKMDVVFSSILTGFLLPSFLELLGFTGFHWVSLGFTGFYWVLLGFIAQFDHVSEVVRSSNEFYWVLPSFT